MEKDRTAKKMFELLATIYKPSYIALNVALAFLYYYAYVFLIKYQDYGVLLNLVPPFLIYLLVITSSVLLTIAIYSIRNTRNNKAYLSASTFGTITALGGGVIAGCGCSAPVLLSLVAIGLSTGQTFAISSFFNNNSIALFGLFILANLLLTAYYLNRL